MERAGGVCEDYKFKHSTTRELSEASVCCLYLCVVDKTVKCCCSVVDAVLNRRGSASSPLAKANVAHKYSAHSLQ